MHVQRSDRLQRLDSDETRTQCLGADLPAARLSLQAPQVCWQPAICRRNLDVCVLIPCSSPSAM